MSVEFTINKITLKEGEKKMNKLLVVAIALLVGCAEYKDRPISREASTEILKGQGDNSEKGQGAGGKR